VSAKADRFRRAAIWFAIVLVTTGGIIGAIGGSWLLRLATQPDEHDRR
jgi:hypothetical protein